MTNKYKGEIKGSLGGQDRTFRLTFENIVNIENTLNKPVMRIAKELAGNDFFIYYNSNNIT